MTYKTQVKLLEELLKLGIYVSSDEVVIEVFGNRRNEIHVTVKELDVTIENTTKNRNAILAALKKFKTYRYKVLGTTK